MKTRTINVYEFKELDEDAKEKALDKLRCINVEGYDWWDCSVDQFKNELNEMGFEDAEIFFSGFYSQGDGACFDATINLEKFCSDKRILAVAKEATFRIEKNSYANHYSHRRTRYVEYDEIGSKRHTRVNAALSELSKTIEGLRMDKCKEIYRSLEKNYDSLVSDEMIIETIEANDYEFDEKGNLI